MGDSEPFFPFPFHSIAKEGASPDPGLFDLILDGEGGMKGFEFGYCLATDPESGQKRYLLFSQRKPYAAGVLESPEDVGPTTLRDFFVHLARHPRIRLDFLATDPVLVKSILVLQQGSPATQGSSEFLRIENQVVELMEGRKDALVALVVNERFSFAFVKGGKAIRAYFQDQVFETARGMEWLDLMKRIETHQARGQRVTIRVYEVMKTAPAEDYEENRTHFPGGVFRHFTRPLPEFILRDPTRTLKRINPGRFPFTIGRNIDSDLVLGESSVSRKHAVIEEREGRFVVRDLDSTNGLFVNEHFTREFALQDGDSITIGNFTLQVVLPRSPAEDVTLLPFGGDEATLTIDGEARVRVACPECGATGFVQARRLYSKNRIRIRCPACSSLFSPER